MSGTGDPLPKSVYLRRRLLVLAGILGFGVAVALIIWRPSFGDARIQTNEVHVPDDLVTVEAQDEADKPAEDEIVTCSSGRIEVTPVIDAASYGPDQEPLLSLRVENVSDTDCIAELGTANMVFEITSGNDQIWRSTDCQIDADYRAVVLQPGEPEETDGIPWNRERSSPETCDLPRPTVSAGGASYHLRVSVAGVTSRETAQFQLY